MNVPKFGRTKTFVLFLSVVLKIIHVGAIIKIGQITGKLK